MKISDVIKRLEELRDKQGECDVEVQFRDAGGPYCGSEDPDFWFDDKRNILLL